MLLLLKTQPASQPATWQVFAFDEKKKRAFDVNELLFYLSLTLSACKLYLFYSYVHSLSYRIASQYFILFKFLDFTRCEPLGTLKKVCCKKLCDIDHATSFSFSYFFPTTNSDIGLRSYGCIRFSFDRFTVSIFRENPMYFNSTIQSCHDYELTTNFITDVFFLNETETINTIFAFLYWKKIDWYPQSWWAFANSKFFVAFLLSICFECAFIVVFSFSLTQMSFCTHDLYQILTIIYKWNFQRAICTHNNNKFAKINWYVLPL